MAKHRNSEPGDVGVGYDSRTEALDWSTAARIGKAYQHEAPVSEAADKSSSRADDGRVTSANYVERKRRDNGRRAAKAASGGATGDTPVPHRYIDMDYHHRLEDYLGTWPMRKLLGFISRTRKSGDTLLEDVIKTYGDPAAPLTKRLKYWPLHKFIDRMKGSVSTETFRQRVSEHISTIRGLVVTARSVAEFGLTIPQRFSAPLFSV
ncbi:hypothetical protein KJ815_14055 [bacterium]|nr:hypothetical protein [bacterium]